MIFGVTAGSTAAALATVSEGFLAGDGAVTDSLTDEGPLPTS